MIKFSKISLIVILGLLTKSEFSYGLNVMEYLRGYNLGINLIGQSEGANVKFNVDTIEDPISNGVTNCGEPVFGQTERTCSIGLNGGGGRGLGASFLHGFGIFLQQPFKRQGNFYFNWDLGIGLQVLNAAWENEEGGFEYPGLEEISYSLYGLQLKPYIQIGWTPNRFPDIIFTLGPVMQMVAGTVSVNEKEETTAFFQSSDIEGSIMPWAQAYFELELVFLRFGDGAISWYLSKAATSTDVEAGDFYSEKVGAMSDFTATFNAYESGFKFLLNWP